MRLVGGTGAHRRHPRHPLRPSVFPDLLVRAGCEARDIVHRSDRDRDGLRRARVHPAVIRTAVVHNIDREGRGAILVRRCLIAEVAGHAVHGGQRAEERVVVRRDEEGERLVSLVRGPCAERRRPSEDLLGTGVLQGGLVCAGREARHVVHRRDRDRDGLRRARIHAAVRRPAVIHQGDREVGHAVRVRGGLIAELTCNFVDGGQLREEAVVVGRDRKGQLLLRLLPPKRGIGRSVHSEIEQSGTASIIVQSFVVVPRYANEEIIQTVVVHVTNPADAGAELETIVVTVELVKL